MYKSNSEIKNAGGCKRISMFKNRKKLVIGLTASALCITSVVGGTLAYFTDKDIRSNVVTLGHVTGTLTETDEHKRDDNTTGKDYYYQNILSNKNDGETSSKVFTKVTIPAEWGNEMADKTFNIDARAEFIQADNFTPVKDAYGNITGWGNADIK